MSNKFLKWSWWCELPDLMISQRGSSNQKEQLRLITTLLISIDLSNYHCHKHRKV
jgi:hypothetical protein